MNPSFTHASETFKKANPAIFGQPMDKNDSRPIVERPRGIPENYETRIVGKLQCSEPQPYQKATLDDANGREIQGLPRTLVRFVGYRCRPLDPDNFAGGCKDLLDGLRHAGLIPGDEPWKITFETAQVKVAHRTQERTEITIED